MFLIAGLGNPGKKYEKTRHNMGFDCVEILEKELKVSMKRSRTNALVGKTFIGSEDVLLVKPQTFMNLSGTAIAALCRFYKIDPEKELIVIYDDVDLEVGHIRVRAKGSAGGHNGMKSIIGCLGIENFKRIRIGIGSKEKDDMIGHVLGRFDSKTREKVDEALEKAAEAAKDIVKNGIDHAMNNFNAG